ncbi:MAG TPA: hypothetical protein VLG11_05470 [Candidatus Saccharimonadales bacterium]|nr:hypothetical protein [Candidatus Saccharimonadales bacterium]
MVTQEVLGIVPTNESPLVAGGKDALDGDNKATNDNEFDYAGIRVNRHEQREYDAAFAEIASHLGELATL